jgi:uncharacterized membrane protein YebE (DUF533 family)
MSASWVIRQEWNIDITKLGAPDFESYGKALFICANGDGKITPPEREWILGYFAAAGYPDSIIEMLSTYDGSGNIDELVKSSVPTQQSIRTLVYDAIRACSADGEFNAGERAMVVRMAAQVGLGADDVAKLESAYKAVVAAAKVRVEAAYPGGVPEAFRAS